MLELFYHQSFEKGSFVKLNFCQKNHRKSPVVSGNYLGNYGSAPLQCAKSD